MRAVSAAGLRWIESPKADKLLAKTLISDPDSYVRKEAAYAMSFRKLVSETFKAQKRALLEDKSMLVRLSVLNNFAKDYKEFPEILDLIRKAAEDDSSEEVRNAAKDILKDL